ncbi:MAG TPA: hypothetical protein VF176_03575 [Solirubrobacterales bacterium]
MKEPFGQIRTEVPATEGIAARTVISAGRDVEQGARSMLLLADGLFRLDVIPHDDSLQTILRNLSPQPHAELRFYDVGGEASVLSAPEEIAPPSTGRFGGEVVLIGPDESERVVARVLVGSVCHLERGVTSFTAQATLS